MKKVVFITNVILLIILLSGCGLRERLLEAPNEVEIPENALIAECTKEDTTFTFIFKDDGVYQYSINNVIQSENILDTILEQAYLHDSSVEKYLEAEFLGACVIENYIGD